MKTNGKLLCETIKKREKVIYLTEKELENIRNESYRSGLVTGYNKYEEKLQSNPLFKELLARTEKYSGVETVEDVFASYIQNRSSILEPGTVAKHISNAQNHIIPYFEDRAISGISVGEIKNFLFKKQENLAYNTVKGIFQTLKAIWKYGYEMGIVSKEKYVDIFVDELTKVTVNRTAKDIAAKNKPVKTYLVEEIESFNRLALEKDKVYYILIQLCYYGGLRASEAIGLRWQNIDFDTGIITIHATVNYNKLTHSRYIGPTKNKSDRVFFAPMALMECLKEWKEEQENNRRIFGEAYRATEIYEDYVDGGTVRGGDFVLRFATGEHLKHNQANQFRAWLQKKTGIHFYYHGLRHTIVSQLHGSGVPVKAISEYIGHHDVDVTMEYYLGNSKEGMDKLKEVIDLM